MSERRRRLPNRRNSETFDIEIAGLNYKVTASRFGILVSLCLQHGCDAATIARALSRNTDGSASGIVGAVLDTVLEAVE